MIDVVEILQHWHAGRPKTVVAASLGVDPKTVRKYVALPRRPGSSPGVHPWGAPSGPRWSGAGFPSLSTLGPAA